MSLILLDLCLRKHKKYALYFQWFKWLPEIADLAKEQHTAVAAQGATCKISLQVFTTKPCKGQDDLRILGHGGFLFLLQ